MNKPTCKRILESVSVSPEERAALSKQIDVASPEQLVELHKIILRKAGGASPQHKKSSATGVK